jgi:hypothetical protein
VLQRQFHGHDALLSTLEATGGKKWARLRPRIEHGDMMEPKPPSTRRIRRRTLEQSLAAYTRGAAAAEMMDGQKGTLAPGMLADLAILSQDMN